jgi:hypothetical protein
MKLGGNKIELSTYVPIGCLMEVTLREPKKGSRISRRDGGVKSPFTNSGASGGGSDAVNGGNDGDGSGDGEWPGGANGSARTRTTSTSSSIGGGGKSVGLAQLVIKCRDFRTLVLTFTERDGGDNDRIHALHDRLAYLIANVPFQPPAFDLGCVDHSEWSRYTPSDDFLRQGLSSETQLEGRVSQWRACHINADHEVCPTYPQVWYVPRCLDDGTVRESAAFRSKGRLPVLSYFHRNGAAIVRCAQPLVGATGR